MTSSLGTECPARVTLEAAVEAGARQLLDERGPMGWSELVDAMVSAGAGRRADVESALEEVMGGDTLVALPDHRVADVTALLEGTVATHRLAAVELHCEVVALDVDLAALTRLEGIDGGAVLASGHLLTPVHDEAGSGWSGPPGWLRGCTAGHLVSFRVHRGRLEVGPAGAGGVLVRGRGR